MSAREVLAQLEALGISAVPRGPNVLLRGATERLDDDLRRRVQEVKPALLALLAERGPWWAVITPGRLRPVRRPDVGDLLCRLARTGVAVWRERGEVHLLAEVEPPAGLLEDVRLAVHDLLDVNLLPAPKRERP